MDPVLEYRGFSIGISSSGLSALYTLYYKRSRRIFNPFSTAVWGSHPLLRSSKRPQRVNFEPTGRVDRKHASYHGTRESRLPSISLSFIARHAVMIRDTCPCCFINTRCGQHDECFIALLTARKVTHFAHSSLSSSEWIWTEYLSVVREVSRCPCHVLCAYCIATSPAGYLSLRRCQCSVRDSLSSAVLGRKLIRR
jgi:hypothetical protein